MFKSLLSVTLLTLVFGLILADPFAREISNTRDKSLTLDDVELSFSLVEEDTAPRALQRSRRFITLSGLNFIGTLIQHKISAISIVVTAIKWIATNVHALIFGGLVSFAFCKLTGKCSINYDQVVPYSEAVGTDYAVAEDIFKRAVNRYKRENGEF